MQQRSIVISVFPFLAVLLLLLPGRANPVLGTASGELTPTPTSTNQCRPAGRIVTQPVVDPLKMCPEYLLEEAPRSALAAITSIAYAPDCAELPEPRDWCGALFFVQPAEGRVMWVGEFDPATRAYSIHLFAEGLTLPTGLVWHAGAWYISSDHSVYRLIDADGDSRADTNEIIVDGLPSGAGAWTGSIQVGPDGRLYVSKGASCSACEESDPRRGSLLSYTLAGNDERIVATGLHNPFDFAWHPTTGELWISDSERDTLGPGLPLDEINRMQNPGEHFGWPYCYETSDGTVISDELPAPALDFCSTATSPALTFPAKSGPAGMVFYNGNAFPEMVGDLLIILRGGQDGVLTSGYALYRICLDEDGQFEDCLDETGSAVSNPNSDAPSQQLLLPIDVTYGHSLEVMNMQGQGFYPDHPVDIAISAEGFITISLLEGRIIRITPRH